MNFDKTFGLENKKDGKIFVGIQKKYHVFYAMIDIRTVDGKETYHPNHDFRCASKVYFNRIARNLIANWGFSPMIDLPDHLLDGFRIEGETTSDLALIYKSGEGILA